MRLVGVVTWGLAVGLVAGCGGGDGGSADAAGGADGALASDAGGADASTADAPPVGPVNAACSELPVTLHPTFNAGFRSDYGVICYNPPGQPDAEDCRIREGLFQLPTNADCAYGGMMVAEFGEGAGAVGGVLDAYFGAGTQVTAASAGTFFDMGVNGVPDGPLTVDFQGGFNTGATVAGTHRIVMTYNADDTVTITSVGPVL